jgi:gliding motility-associated-like protein
MKNSTSILQLFALLLLVFISRSSYAQIGTEFWFVAPEVTSEHGDENVVLRITAFDQEANVTISMPQNSSFNDQKITVPANSQEYYQFSDADVVENKPPNQVNDKGIFISSDVDISAYYEITNPYNPDKFTLKGENALGTEFFVPSQNELNNHHEWNWSIDARERVDIVATEDGTTVDITVNDDIEGHPKGSSFTVSLDRGETYSIWATKSGESYEHHLGGTHISSDKPVAVTISDDSLAIPNEEGCYDIVGDQLIPTDLIGSSYIVMNPLYGQSGIKGSVFNKVYVLAIADDTEIFVNDKNNPKGELQKGELMEVDISDNAIFLFGDKDFYAYQITGIPHQDGYNPPTGAELGSAVLPSITCTGSASVSFTRIMTQRFYVQLTTQKSAINAFSIETTTGKKPDDYFKNLTWNSVKGTGNDDPEKTWYTAVIQMGGTNSGISTGDPYRITNSKGLFHMSILDENEGSMSFGYFSDYSSLRIKGPGIYCKGSQITLSTQDPMKSYKWYRSTDLGGNELIADGVDHIEVNEPGKYWLTSVVNQFGCELTDTLEIKSVTPEFSLGKDQIVCPGELVTFKVDATSGDTFHWLPGDSTSNTYTATPGADETIDIILTVGNYMTKSELCEYKDTVSVKGQSAPEITWNITGKDVCLGDTIRTTTKMKKYEWSVNNILVENHDEPYIVATTSGTYALTVWTDDDCSGTKSLNLTIHQPPSVDINDMGVCSGQTGTYTLSGYDTYLWKNTISTLSTQNFVDLISTDSIFVTVTNALGCEASDSAFFEIYNQEVFSFGADTSVCINNPITIEIDDQYSNYQWTFSKDGTGTPQTLTTTNHIYTIANATNNDEGKYTITATDNIHGCQVEGSFYLTVEDTPDLDIREEEHICHGDTIKIETQDHKFSSFRWTMDSDPSNILGTDSYILVANQGTYRLTAWQDNGCSATATSEVNVWDSPSFSLPAEVKACPNTSISVEMNPGTWSSPQSGVDANPRNYVWSTGSPRAVFSTGQTLNNPDQGTYYLTVEDALCFFTDSVKVSYYTPTAITLDDAESCDNIPYTLKIPAALQTEISPSGNYFWSQENTSNQGPANSDWTVSDKGIYQLNITDNNGCKASGTMLLSHLLSPVFSLGNNRDKCDGDTIMIKVGPDYTRYEWNGNTSDGQTNAITVTSSDTYSLQVWNDNGCSATKNVDIQVNPLPDVNLGDNDLYGCAGEKFNLSIGNYKHIYWSTGKNDVNTITVGEGTFSVNVVDENGCIGHDEIQTVWYPIPKIDLGEDLVICPVEYPVPIEAPEGFEHYLWQTGETSRSIRAELADTVNSVNVWDKNGCPGYDTKLVRSILPPDYSLGDDLEACEPEELELDAGTEIVRSYADTREVSTIQSYQWSDSSANQTDTVSKSGTYWVEVFDGCFYLRDTINVEYFPAPEITGLDTTYYAQVTVFANNGTMPYYYALDDEAQKQTGKTFKNVESGEHTVYVEDCKGCKASTVFSLSSDIEIKVPDFFTPNNDGFNDQWTIEGLERLPESTVSIFDRYGKLLHKFNASETVSWDGEYLNKPVPSDDYWYVIHLQPINKLLKGHVTVKR